MIPPLPAPDASEANAADGSLGGTSAAARAPASGLVVVAASAGGVQALRVLVQALPSDLVPAVAIVQHRPPTIPSQLRVILALRARVPVVDLLDGTVPQRGTVYVAPPDMHVTVTSDRRFRLVDGRRIRHVRSSANPLFETAAAAYGDRVLAIVLTGGGRDATDGVQAVASAGGFVAAQDPSTAHTRSMPQSAIDTGVVSTVLHLDAIAPYIVEHTKDWR